MREVTAGRKEKKQAEERLKQSKIVMAKNEESTSHLQFERVKTDL